MTEEISGSLNGLATDMLETVDLVRSLSPTEREEDARRWGPWPVSQLGGAFLLVEIVRRGGDQYDWSFGLAEVEAGPFVDVFTGTHLAGSSVALGDGAFSWDLDALAGVTGLLASGRLDVDYDNRVGTEFLMDLQDLSFPGMTRTLDADYWYHQDEASKGDFEYETSGDVGGGAAREDVEARTRWTEGGEGRSDARVSGGDLAEAITISECWDATGDLVYLVDTHGLFEGIGEPGACAFLEPALPEHIEAR
jgi:hypothetical protein